MKTLLSLRMLSLSLALVMFTSSVSCTTTYDRSGRPVQSVDPGAATVGVVAAGILGYALANGDKKKHHHGHRHHYGHGYHHRPYYGSGYHCR